jgi:hypothetical protein
VLCGGCDTGMQCEEKARRDETSAPSSVWGSGTGWGMISSPVQRERVLHDLQSDLERGVPENKVRRCCQAAGKLVEINDEPLASRPQV